MKIEDRDTRSIIIHIFADQAWMNICVNIVRPDHALCTFRKRFIQTRIVVNNTISLGYFNLSLTTIGSRNAFCNFVDPPMQILWFPRAWSEPSRPTPRVRRQYYIVPP